MLGVDQFIPHLVSCNKRILFDYKTCGKHLDEKRMDREFPFQETNCTQNNSLSRDELETFHSTWVVQSSPVKLQRMTRGMLFN
jgi:hypothetical protein